MAVVILSGDVEAHRQVVLDLFTRHLNPLYDAARFEWVYRRNPEGPGRLWIAVDEGTGEVIGAASAFPRRMVVPDGLERALVLGDFCLDDRYRSLGPALKLQRACLAEVDAGQAAFCYDFPSPGMMAVYRRLGVEPVAAMVRLSVPLRIDERLDQHVGIRPVSRMLGAIGNRLLAARMPRWRPRNGLSIETGEAAFGEEFSVLAREVGARYGVCVHRSGAYLRWRYHENPTGRFEFTVARRAGRLRAYAVVSRRDGHATIEDLFGVDEAGTLEALVAGVVRRLRAERIVTVNAPILDSHALLPVLRRCGFRPRESRPVVARGSASGWPDGRVKTARWGLLFGDRDS
jgi:hypothetical protein